eukprot:1192739-Prorocentrum_minimum.AAC.4
MPLVIFTLSRVLRLTRLATLDRFLPLLPPLTPSPHPLSTRMQISMHPAVNAQLAKFHGVVNGIDPEIWGPDVDPFLPVKFDSDSCTEGKQACREALRQRLGLTGW